MVLNADWTAAKRGGNNFLDICLLVISTVLQISDSLHVLTARDRLSTKVNATTHLRTYVDYSTGKVLRGIVISI